MYMQEREKLLMTINDNNFSANFAALNQISIDGSPLVDISMDCLTTEVSGQLL